MVSLMGTLVYRLVISKDARVELCGMWMCSVFLTRSMLFLIDVLLLRLIFSLIILSSCFVILWEGACVLFIKGLMGMLGVCIFGNAFSLGGLGFICLRFLAFSGLIICFVLFINLLIGL